MVKAEFCYFSRGTDIQKLSTATHPNGLLADNQILEVQGPWLSQIYVRKSPQGGGGGGLGGGGEREGGEVSISGMWHVAYGISGI